MDDPPLAVGGTSDPYVVVWLENEVGEKVLDVGCERTSGYRERTLNPEWNEELIMGSANLEIRKCTLKFEVMDYDIIGADDEMGTAEIPLKIFLPAAASRGAASSSPSKGASGVDGVSKKVTFLDRITGKSSVFHRTKSEENGSPGQPDRVGSAGSVLASPGSRRDAAAAGDSSAANATADDSVKTAHETTETPSATIDDSSSVKNRSPSPNFSDSPGVDGPKAVVENFQNIIRNNADENDSPTPQQGGDIQALHRSLTYAPRNESEDESDCGGDDDDDGDATVDSSSKEEESNKRMMTTMMMKKKKRKGSKSMYRRVMSSATMTKKIDPQEALRDFLASGASHDAEAFEFPELTDGRQIGSYSWITPHWIHAELMLVSPDMTKKVRQEAMAMLNYATQILDPRNVVKTLSNTNAGTWLTNKMDAAVAAGKRKALSKFDDAVEQQRLRLVAQIVQDRDMPRALKKYIGAAANIFFTDIQRDLMDAVSRQLGVQIPGAGRRRNKSRRSRGIAKYRRTCISYIRDRLLRLRAWVLYIEHPYDKSIWGKVRSPMWWIFLVIKVFPGWGVQSTLFFLKLCIIDRSDEWQLFEYIVQCKGLQFISGVISILLGVLKYVYCAGIVDRGEPHTCHVNGPGVDNESACSTLPFAPCVTLIVSSTLSRILLSWFAFYLIRNSFAFGKQIVGEHRIVGARIEVHEFVPGPSPRWSIFGRCFARVRTCWSVAFSSEKQKLTPLRRFRIAVELVMDMNRTANGSAGAPKLQSSAVLDGKFHIRRRKAKIMSYDAAKNTHVIVYKDDSKHERHVIDLDALIFSVTRMKRMNPRRFQAMLNGYDIMVFTFAVFITLRYAFEIDYDGGEQWKLFALIFWTQAFYALFAVPFLLTVIPVVQKLICTARCTGYDRNGELRATFVRTKFEKGLNEPNPRSKIAPGCYPAFTG